MCSSDLALALLWKAAGLYPGRAYREDDPSYKSKFQRYSDLILTAVAEPWAQRHSSELDHTLPQPSPALAPFAAWLISEHILRKGMRLQKQRR